ncbi:hypothetical protein KAQ80_00960 [Candidatus Bipolaricaulota bacterium]|nr:hypothetical protein [Candidatus Bipolaricaulota bacterium]
MSIFALTCCSVMVQVLNAIETEVLPDTMDDRVILILTPIACRFILSHMNIKQRLLQILNVEQARHPQMTGQDLQKLAYQASLGCDHFLGNRKQFEQDLSQEWNKLNASTNIQEYPLQVIDPFGKTARLYLSPCKLLGLSLEELVALLVAQPSKDGEKEDYDRLWAHLTALAAEGKIPFSADELAGFAFPRFPPRHSSHYGFTAYRVINDLTHCETTAWIKRNRFLSLD